LAQVVPHALTTYSVQNEFGYFGTLLVLGDFAGQLRPQDFANGWHEWLQQSNVAARMVLENLALDILAEDYAKEEIELKVRDVSLLFDTPSATHHDIETGAEFIRASLDGAFPFADQVGGLLTHLINQSLGDYSIWWYGQAGQTQSQIVVCNGLPSHQIYLRLLTLEEAQAPEEKELDYVDKIIAGDV